MEEQLAERSTPEPTRRTPERAAALHTHLLRRVAGAWNTISGTRHARDVRSRNRTDCDVSGRSCRPDRPRRTNSVIAVSTNPGASAVTWMPRPSSFCVAWEKPITPAFVAE